MKHLLCACLIPGIWDTSEESRVNDTLDNCEGKRPTMENMGLNACVFKSDLGQDSS